MSNFQEAKKLLGRGDVEGAISLLPKTNELIMCLARIKQANINRRLGILPHSDYQLLKNRVHHAVAAEIKRIEGYKPTKLMNCIAELDFEPIKKAFKEKDVEFSWKNIDAYFETQNQMQKAGEKFDAAGEQESFDLISDDVKRLIELVYRLVI